jgi:hypothetical protein
MLYISLCVQAISPLRLTNLFLNVYSVSAAPTPARSLWPPWLGRRGSRGLRRRMHLLAHLIEHDPAAYASLSACACPVWGLAATQPMKI